MVDTTETNKYASNATIEVTTTVQTRGFESAMEVGVEFSVEMAKLCSGVEEASLAVRFDSFFCSSGDGTMTINSSKDNLRQQVVNTNQEVFVSSVS
jgi:hypothetical protein